MPLFSNIKVDKIMDFQTYHYQVINDYERISIIITIFDSRN